MYYNVKSQRELIWRIGKNIAVLLISCFSYIFAIYQRGVCLKHTVTFFHLHVLSVPGGCRGGMIYRLLPKLVYVCVYAVCVLYMERSLVK